jgi:hypothetical protein
MMQYIFVMAPFQREAETRALKQFPVDVLDSGARNVLIKYTRMAQMLKFLVD